jgi:hypothetical protein
MDDRGIGVSFLAELSIFLLYTVSILVLAHPASCAVGTDVPFLGIKQLGCEADRHLVQKLRTLGDMGSLHIVP